MPHLRPNVTIWVISILSFLYIPITRTRIHSHIYKYFAIEFLKKNYVSVCLQRSMYQYFGIVVELLYIYTYRYYTARRFTEILLHSSFKN